MGMQKLIGGIQYWAYKTQLVVFIIWHAKPNWLNSVLGMQKLFGGIQCKECNN